MKKVITLIVAIIMALSLTSCGKEKPVYTLTVEPHDGFAYVTVYEDGADFETEYKVFSDTIRNGCTEHWTGITETRVQSIIDNLCQ